MSDSQQDGPVQVALVSSPVEAISGVWMFRRAAGGYRQARSLPGHLLHLLLQGSYLLRSNAREYSVKTGDLIYYHETEKVEWLGNREDVVFYSAGFLAPTLSPLPLDSRVFPADSGMRRSFERLYEASLLLPGNGRSLRMHAKLLELLSAVPQWSAQHAPSEGETPRSWREIEAFLRERKLFRTSIDEIGRLAHMSRASVARACRAATGTSPMKRLREMRMAEARGLLRFSHLSVSQVAQYLGYPRIHEFSREFSRQFGTPPSRWRRS
jgi:AraC-like DNA-binding protein